MNKRYVFVPPSLFGRIVRHGMAGDLVFQCPQCHDDVTTHYFWTESGTLAGDAATLDYVECPRCVIRLYPAGGSFTARNPEPRQAAAAREQMAQRVTRWERWTDKRSGKEYGRLRDAVTRRVRQLGLSDHQHAQLIVRHMLLPHRASDGTFQHPEIYTWRDLSKLDALPDLCEQPLPTE